MEDPEEEVKRVEAAREQAVAQLQKLYDKALQEVGESGAAIFEVHQMMMTIWIPSTTLSVQSL